MQLWETCMWCLAVAQKEQVSKCVACHVICHIQLTASRCCDRSPVWRGKKTHQNNKEIPQHKLFYVVGNLLLPPVHQDSCEAANSWIITEARGILLKLHLLQKEINSLTSSCTHKEVLNCPCLHGPVAQARSQAATGRAGMNLASLEAAHCYPWGNAWEKGEDSP